MKTGATETVAQAEELDALLAELGVSLDAALNYELPLEVIVARRRDALFVPNQAILEREGRKRVYTVADGRARATTVKVGESNWNSTEILKGLREGDRVVINPDAPGLSEGARVLVE